MSVVRNIAEEYAHAVSFVAMQENVAAEHGGVTIVEEEVVVADDVGVSLVKERVIAMEQVGVAIVANQDGAT